jgi:hypothetical protein
MDFAFFEYVKGLEARIEALEEFLSDDEDDETETDAEE